MSLSPIATMSAEEIEALSEVFWYIAILGGMLLTAGLIGEFPESEKWKKNLLYKLSKIAVIIGVGAELIADSAIFKAAEREQQLVNQSMESHLKVQKAMLDQLKARGFTKGQFAELVQSLKGRWEKVSVYTLTDTEATFFGNAIIYAFQKADVRVEWMRPTVPTDVFMVQGVPMTGVHLYVSQETPGFKDLVQNFLDSFQRAGVTGLGTMTPDKPLVGIPSPSIFVAKHEVPFMQYPEYGSPFVKFPKPEWQP